MKTFPRLCARTETGAVQIWDIIVDGDKYFTRYGQLNGLIQETKPTVALPTNVGRSNERNGEEQAEFEAAAIHKKKIESGYCENVKDIDKYKFTQPMLAKKFEDYQDDIKYPVYSNPKMDGIRAVISRHGAFSRNGKRHLTVPHILKSLQPFFEKFPDAILDGELYCDKLNNDFNKICSLVKKTKPTQKDLDESASTIEYHVYDLVDEKWHFGARAAFLKGEVRGDKIVIVPAIKVNNKEELDALYEGYLKDGYEGQMVRIDDVYQEKRSKFLLKRKEFCDAEWEILDIIEGVGNRAGMAGNMVFKTKNGENFNSNIKGDRALLKEYLVNKLDYVGKLATIRYFNLTERGVPRFPFVHSVRNYE